MAYVDSCSNAGADLYLGADGRLFLRAAGAPEATLLDFNTLYAGYYPRCTFTAVAAGGGLFYAAGLDTDGRPRLFTSLSGGVWEERPLAARDPLGGVVRAEGRVLRVLFAEEARQAFLVTDAAQVVTLPDCPKCLRVRPLPQRPTDARLSGDALEIDFADSTRTRIPLTALTQYRVSWSYADRLLRQGARIVDLREADDFARGHLPGSVNVPFARLADWLSGRGQGEALLFLCRTGALADEAADYARGEGWAFAYSMGGLNAFGHIE